MEKEALYNAKLHEILQEEKEEKDTILKVVGLMTLALKEEEEMKGFWSKQAIRRLLWMPAKRGEN